MNWSAALGLLLLPVVTLAGDVPANPFPDEKIGVPPLSLGEAARQGVPPLPSGGPNLLPGKIALRPATPRQFSHMPVVAPRSDIDPKIRVVTPDASVDHKMIVKQPDIEVRR